MFQKGCVMDTRWSTAAYKTAVEAAREERPARRRWDGQNEWDADNMRTESTRFTRALDEKLRQCCKEAGVTRYTLINYLLRVWMAAWETYRGA
nr:hypothetical protein [uncultured Dysosmobacter sp.]